MPWFRALCSLVFGVFASGSEVSVSRFAAGMFRATDMAVVFGYVLAYGLTLCFVYLTGIMMVRTLQPQHKHQPDEGGVEHQTKKILE